MSQSIKKVRRPSAQAPPSFDGFLLPRRPPRGLPEIPFNLTDIDEKRLMELFTAYVVWNNFIDVRRVQAEIEEANAETVLKVLEATSLAAGWDGGKDSRITIARAERDIDPEVVAARTAHDEARARRKLLQVLSDNMQRGSNLLSRELTRRVGRESVVRRNDNSNP